MRQELLEGGKACRCVHCHIGSSFMRKDNGKAMEEIEEGVKINGYELNDIRLRFVDAHWMVADTERDHRRC